MPKIAVFGGTGYLSTIIKNQNILKKNKYTFFSSKKTSKNYLNYSTIKKRKNIFKNFDFVIHLAGPNQKQLKKNEKLINKKKKITSIICDLCLANNIKLIYVSSMQIYKYYGKKNLTINSEINLNNSYSKSHYDSEKIIFKKFLDNKKMFTILRMGNVFGFKKYNNLKIINDNLIHSLCNMALKKKKITINNGSIQRTFVPSQIFIQVINLVIKKNLFNNSIENISYKNLNLKEVANIIQKRLKLLFKLDTNIIIEIFKFKKIFKIYSNKYFKFNSNNKKIYFEIDQILKCIKKKK